MKKYWQSALLVLLLASPAAAWEGRAVRVPDGDSLSVQGPGKELVKVRLYGVDAPESRQRFGPQARKRLATLVSRRRLVVEPVDTDRYGRTVALVRLPDGTLVNEVLVAEGLAWVYDEYCHRELCQRLGEMQNDARLERRGLWAQSAPTRPADWRRAHKAEEWYKAPVRGMKKAVRTLSRVLRY